jgi:hypothetical protein
MALMRALRIELRRSSAAGIAVLLLLIGAAGLIWGSNSAPGGWASMAYTQRVDLLIMWPLAVGAGAWQARRERLGGVRELFATSPRSLAQRAAPVAAALAIAVVLAYLLLLLVGTVRIVRSPADAYFTLEGGAAAAVGAFSLVPAAWLGLSLGRLIPSAFTAPVVTLLGLAAVVLVDELDGRMSGPAFGLLMPALEAPSQRDHVQLPLAVSGQQGLWLVALAVTAFAITTAASRRGRLLALVPAVAAALIVIPALPPGDTDLVYADDKDAMRPVCTRDAPKVCVLRVHSGLLGEVTGPARKALQAMAFLPDAPTSVIEMPEPPPGSLFVDPAVKTTPEAPVDPRTLPLTVSLNRSGHIDGLEQLATALLQEGAAPSCPASEQGLDIGGSLDHQDWTARNLAWAWLARRAGTPAPELPPDHLFDQGWTTLTALPAGTQQQRITALRANAVRCHGDLYADLTEGAA